MNDLFCAATLILARHGEAEYEDEAGDDGGSLTTTGRAQARALADRLKGQRVADVWCSDMSRAVQTAEIVAARLDLPVRVRPQLREFRAATETGPDVVRRMTDVLQTAADLHRGETMLIVGHGDAFRLGVPPLALNVRADFAMGAVLDNVGTCELLVDADGWILRTWNGTAVDDLEHPSSAR